MARTNEKAVRLGRLSAHYRQRHDGRLGQRIRSQREYAQPLSRVLGFIVAIAAVAFLLVGVTSADSPDCRPSLTDRQRYGYTAHAYNWHETFDIARLRAGWYVDHSYTTSRPQGMDRTVLVKLRAPTTREIIDPTDVLPLIEPNPGAIWLIGNEPDQPNEFRQDALLPEEYARLYHDLYILIKSRDRTSRIAAGGIVQPTPVRLQYLDRVLSAYQARYGEPMPVDLWHIHNAILNEVSCEYDPTNCWGALVPPGINAGHGEIRDVQDNDNMTMFKEQIRAFRRWMADHGYRGYPLIVTEYGILMSRDYHGFPETRVNAFMSATFDFFQTATDPLLGDPSDGNRLVQRWAWFWLDGFHYHPVNAPDGFNGFLFHQQTAGFTATGQRYASHTAGFPPLTYVDLGIATLRVSPDSNPSDLGPGSSLTLQVRAVSIGTSAAAGTDLELSYNGPVDGVLRGTLSGLSPDESEWLSLTLKDLEPGAYEVSVKVDPDGKVSESLECNNQASMTFVVPTDRAYLPVVAAASTRSTVQGGPVSREAAPAPPREAWPSDAEPGFQEFALPTSNSYAGQIALDLSKGLVWVTERDGNKIARFDPATREWEEFDEADGLSSDGKPWGLAVDGAGNVWFAATATNRIGKLDATTGRIREFDIPTPNSQPWDVALGDDGSIWFTEQAGNKIGKLDPGSGSMTEYPLKNANAQPRGIDVKGNYVWFAETAANRIGWLNITTGDMCRLQRPAGSLPQDVTLHSSTRIWWTETGADRIVLFAPSTANPILEIDAPQGTEPYGIALEGEIAVWFTERAGNRLGRYVGGTVPWQYELPTPASEPMGIKVDGEGCAWYAAPGTNRIGASAHLRHSVPFCP